MRTLSFIGLLLMPHVVSAQIVISEVMWVGSAVSSADEWLELVNISEDRVDLSGWSVWRRGSDGSMVEMILFPEDAEIAPGAFYLIANYDSDASALSVAPDLVSTSVSLSNSQLYLELRNVDGDTVDAVDDGTGIPFSGGKNPYASMERIDLFTSGEDASNWKTADASIGFDTDDIFGTPKSRVIISVESSATSSSEASVVPVNVRITEALANPEGSDDYEWIELQNLGDTPVDITGWVLSDGSRTYVIEPRNEDGYLLQPGEYTVFFHYQTGIALTDDDVIILENTEEEIDRLALSEAGEEISVGRKPDGSRGVFCIPTPRETNTELPLSPRIVVQSGRATDYTKVTLNLNTEVEKGSLKDAQCHWDFDDGTESETCNPPSHTWDYVGVYTVTLRVTTRCGNEIEKKMEAVVLQKKRLSSASKMMSRRSSSVSSSSTGSLISSNNEQKIYSISSSDTSSSTTTHIDQKKYSNITSSRSVKTPVEQLKIRYTNVPEYSSASFASFESFKVYQSLPQATRAGEAGLPWILLFSQSALWVVLAGKRLL